MGQSEGTTRWQDLHNRWAAWNTREVEFEHKAIQVMLTFFRGFRMHCGLQPVPTGDRDVTIWAVDEHSEGLEKFREVSGLAAALNHDNERWRFGVGVRIGTGMHWLNLFFDIGFTMDDQKCELIFLDRNGPRFSHVLAQMDKTALVPAYEHMLGTVESLLATPPWDRVRKSPIGFAVDGR